MSNWAEIDENNIVLRVTVGDNDDPNNDEGHQWLLDNLGGRWIKTSYNTHGGIYYDNETWTPSSDQTKALRKNFASIGDTYDESLDAFIKPKPFQSWTLNEETCIWESPIPYPNDSNVYIWNEENQSWNEVE